MNVRTSTLASIFLFLAIPACSSATDASDDGTDTTTADLSVCKKEQCGPALEMPTLICDDGSVGGNTGRCIRTKGKCHWEIRECPAPAPDPAPAPTPAPSPVPPKLDCSAPGACGPALGMPNYVCPDGKTVAGPTGRCLDKGGVCGWEVISCPSSTVTCGKATCAADQICCPSPGGPIDEPTCITSSVCPL